MKLHQQCYSSIKHNQNFVGRFKNGNVIFQKITKKNQIANNLAISMRNYDRRMETSVDDIDAAVQFVVNHGTTVK